MITQLAGLRFKAHSPSLYQLEGEELALIMDESRRWYIWCRGKLGWLGHWSRDDAATYVALSIAKAELSAWAITDL